MSDVSWVQTVSLEAGIPKSPALRPGFSVIQAYKIRPPNQTIGKGTVGQMMVYG
jgi:hypothetical protein